MAVWDWNSPAGRFKAATSSSERETKQLPDDKKKRPRDFIAGVLIAESVWGITGACSGLPLYVFMRQLPLQGFINLLHFVKPDGGIRLFVAVGMILQA